MKKKTPPAPFKQMTLEITASELEFVSLLVCACIGACQTRDMSTSFEARHAIAKLATAMGLDSADLLNLVIGSKQLTEVTGKSLTQHLKNWGSIKPCE